MSVKPKHRALRKRDLRETERQTRRRYRGGFTLESEVGSSIPITDNVAKALYQLGFPYRERQ